MLKLIITLVCLLSAAAAVRLLLRRFGPPQAEPHSLHVYKRKPLLTNNEQAFYRALRAAAGRDAAIFAQVPISAIVTADRSSQNRQASHNRIDRKTVDFVLTNPETFDVIAAIEVDDRTHDQPKRRERDRFVNSLFESVGIRLHRVRARQDYDPRELRSLLRFQDHPPA